MLTCNFDPIFFSLGALSVHWYGMMYLIDFLLAAGVITWDLRTQGRSDTYAQVLDQLFWFFLAVVVGGRVGYFLFYAWEKFFADPLALFRVWEGGMSFHGGAIGVIIAGLVLVPRWKMGWWRTLDLAAMPMAVIMFFGRLGNLLNCELYGREADVLWGVIFPIGGEVARHPSQLYEMGMYLFLGLVLYLFHRKNVPTGILFGISVTGLGLARFVNEFFREPDYYVSFLTIGQVLSLPLMICGAGIVLYRLIKK